MHVENVHEPIVNLNIKMVDNRLFMVYNTNIRNFYLNERNKLANACFYIKKRCRGVVTMENEFSNRISVKNIVLAGMFAAFLAVMSQVSLPMPTGVPITVQVFAVALVGVILGWKRGVLAVLVYILIGAVGVPVFANFKGGLSVLTGLTGGYIIAWPVMTILCGIQPKTQNAKLNMTVNIILSLVGLAVCEGVGALQWALLSGNDLRGIIIYSLTAFVPKDIVLTVLAVIIGRQVRKMAAKAGEL